VLTEGLDRARERRRVVGDEDRGGTRRGSGKERCGGALGLLIHPGRPCVFRDGAPGSAGARTRRCGVTGVEQRLGSGGKTGVMDFRLAADVGWRDEGVEG